MDVLKPNHTSFNLVSKDVCAFSTWTLKTAASEICIFILLVSLPEGNFLPNCQTYIKFKKTEMSSACFWVDLTKNIENAVNNARKYLSQEIKVHFRVNTAFLYRCSCMSKFRYVVCV